MRLEEKVEEFQRTGDYALGKSILNESYKLAESIIMSKYRNFGFLEDLLSESHDAIISAIYAFDLENKTKFLTFCSTCINNRIKNFIKKKSNAMEVEDKCPYSPVENYNSLFDIKESLCGLSDDHVSSLFSIDGSKSMNSRAKKKFFKLYKNGRKR